MLMANLKHYSFHYDAHYYIGKINYYGWYGDINHSTPFMLQQGFDFYYRGAQGFAPAKYELGLLLWNGMKLWHGDFTITKDKNTALKLMRDAARDGVLEAIQWVKDHKGNIYLKHPELPIPDVDPNFADNLVKTNVPIVPIIWPKN